MRCVLLCVLSLFSSIYGDQISQMVCEKSELAWETDYQQALKMSHEDKKPLLLFFNGSDWSGLAMKMKNEVLDTDSFREKICSQFHCVEVDFPLHTKLAAAEQEQNTRLKAHFAVEEYPLLLILDSNEREIVRLGYLPENEEQLAGELLHVVAQDAELCRGLKDLPQEENALRHLYELAQGLSNSDAQEVILTAGAEGKIPFFQLERYRLLVEAGEDVSALRASLLKSKDYQVHFTMAMIDFQERASTLEDPREIIKPLESYLERFSGLDNENVWRIEMMIAQFYLDADEWGRALEHAETAYEAAPGPFREEINHSLLYIREQIR